MFMPQKAAFCQPCDEKCGLASEALADKLRGRGGRDKPWMKAFGKLRSLREETARINRIIAKEFGQTESEDCK